MPESYQIDAERGVVTCCAWGVLTNADLREHYRRLAADPDFRPSYAQLADLRGVTEYTVDSELIESAARAQIFDPGTRRAFVAPHGVAFGLARMFAAHSASVGQVLEVFSQIEDAEAWLGR